MDPKFRAGQSVRLLGGFPHRSAADGPYKVLRQLPDLDGDFQYRVKSEREQHERVVKESDIESLASSS